MKIYTQEELDNMDLDTAMVEISNHAYEATQLFEILEGKGKVSGNGHHIRQEVCAFVQKLMREHWKGG